MRPNGSNATFWNLAMIREDTAFIHKFHYAAILGKNFNVILLILKKDLSEKKC